MGSDHFIPSLNPRVRRILDRFPYAAAVTIHRRREAGSVARANGMPESCGKSVPLLGPTFTYLASYLVIGAVISACPLSRLFYDKGCTHSPPSRMKLRRSIARVRTLLPSLPFRRPFFSLPWLNHDQPEGEEIPEQRFYPRQERYAIKLRPRESEG